jgi:hypothetical protein
MTPAGSIRQQQPQINWDGELSNPMRLRRNTQSGISRNPLVLHAWRPLSPAPKVWFGLVAYNVYT